MNQIKSDKQKRLEYTVGDRFVSIRRGEDFSPELIFRCGQCFRWEREPLREADEDAEGVWTGVAMGRVLTLAERGDRIEFRCSEMEFREIWYGYFDFDRDYAALRRRISADPFTARAAAFGKGIRILRQDPWEALCTFILSQCNNIARIKSIVERFCECFGEPRVHMGKRVYLFPAPERIAALDARDLEPLRAGYRAAYLLHAAEEAASGRLPLAALACGTTAEAVRALTALKGVGVKVANCVALFGLGKTDAFPVDVWIRRALDAHYGGKEFDSTVFGGDAGIAQQYIFHYIRHLDSRHLSSRHLNDTKKETA